jgi:hypothetical protein
VVTDNELELELESELELLDDSELELLELIELELESDELDELLSELELLELELGATPPHVVCVTVKLPPSCVPQHEYSTQPCAISGSLSPS